MSSSASTTTTSTAETTSNLKLANTAGSSGVANKSDGKYRKIYRSLVDKSKKLDEIYKSENAFLRIFQTETTLLREKLKTYCETLIFREPIEYAKKAEEILWRKVFYEIINIVKLNKKNLKCNAEIETMYRLHLSSAYGFYNHLLLRFQAEFNTIMKLEGFLNFPFILPEKSSNSLNTDKPELLREALTRILHKFLICLGDLARYQTEYDPSGCTKLACKYYQMSLVLLPLNGIPLNQLGTLFGGENYGCDAAYYYLYCLSCTEPFQSARDNLKLVFSKNRKRYDELNVKHSNKLNNTDSSVDLLDENLDELRTKEIKKFLISFLYIIDNVLSNSGVLSYKHLPTYSNIDTQKLQEMCQLCLQQLNSCMFYTQTQTLAHLSDDLIFKLIFIIIMTIEQLKVKKSSSESSSVKQQLNVYFTCVAFGLMFFSHVVNHTIIRFQESLFNTNKLVKEKVKLNDDFKDEKKIEPDDEPTNNDHESSDKNVRQKASKKTTTTRRAQNEKSSTKKKIQLIYGHRRRKHNSDSDTNESEVDDVSSGSAASSENDSFTEQTHIDDTTRPRRSRRGTGPRHRNNVAKFLERENLSETELNRYSNTSSDTSSDDEKSHSRSSTSLSSSSSSSSSSTSSQSDREVSSSSKTTTTTTTTINTNQPPVPYANFSTADEINERFAQNPIDNSTNNFNVSTSANFTNLKEFSIQLLSNFSLLNTNTTNADQFICSVVNDTAGQPPPTLTTTINNTTTDEFIDNEIYKLVLNGRRDMGIPPGFELNSKEAFEIEELGKKIATFQIETDSEASSFDDNDASMSNDEDKATNSGKEEPTKHSKSLDIQSVKQLIDAFQSQTLLPAIKIFCDWLLCNKKIIQSISNVSTTMWSKLAILLNLMPSEKQIASLCSNEKVKNVILKSFETKSWNNLPLSEDIRLRSFNSLKLEHIALKFDINKLNELNSWDEHLIRICCLRRFGYLIASLSQSQNTGAAKFFEYDYQRAFFVAHGSSTDSKLADKNEDDAKYDTAIASDATSTEASQAKPALQTNLKDDRKLQLMRSMAQLRLEAEISQLESNYKNAEVQISPYVIVDTQVLCNNLRIIQELSRLNKFLIIIPLSVIDYLDQIKKESRLAREVIRWLENQLKQGNRFLRVQNQNEKQSEKKTKKKKDFDIWCFNQILDCCEYFQQQEHHTAEGKKTKMVTLLFDKTNQNYSEIKFKESLNLVKQKEIEMIDVKEFYERCKIIFS